MNVAVVVDVDVVVVVGGVVDVVVVVVGCVVVDIHSKGFRANTCQLDS